MFQDYSNIPRLLGAFSSHIGSHCLMGWSQQQQQQQQQVFLQQIMKTTTCFLCSLLGTTELTLITVVMYEGHPMNKLLKGIILLIFRIWKIRDIRFVGNLFVSKICEFYYDDIIMTSVMNVIYGDVTVESIPQRMAFCHSFSLGWTT